MFWHQLLPWLFNRLQEKPLEVGRAAQLLSRLFRQISWEGIAAIPRTVPLLAEPVASMGARRGRETARLCDLHEGGYAGHAIHEITPAARCLHSSALITGSERRFVFPVSSRFKS
jgi:hypothetical protein